MMDNDPRWTDAQTRGMIRLVADLLNPQRASQSPPETAAGMAEEDTHAPWTAEDGTRLVLKLQALTAYYRLTRGVGHTQLLFEGTQHPSHTTARILALTQQEASALAQASGLPDAQGLSWETFPGNLITFQGARAPLAVDHAVLEACLTDCLREIARLAQLAAPSGA